MGEDRAPVNAVNPLGGAPPDHPMGLGEDSGPNPMVRAAVGLLVGLAAGAVAAALTPRTDRAPHTPAMSSVFTSPDR
ncbi:MAG: hypothetical protein M3493_08220 [Actinomycetota bacterium]|nr:hypothetical protein [Actinomycetota bacterium]